MSEPSISSISTGAGIVTFATLALGPILGEYSIIIAFGLLGTLMALSESVQPTILKSVIFVFKGITLSFVFTGIVTSMVVKFSPVDMGLTPYFIMGAVAFMIGWFSNRANEIKDKLFSKFSSLTSPKE
jgi:ABC-type Fe3+-siderophore transport system permease subunit